MNAPKGEQTIFTEALRLAPEDRAAYVAKATSGNPELREEIESLLRNYDAGEFLEEAAAPDLRTSVDKIVSERPGDRIGRYKLLQQIGEGGCGVVYMAEQFEPVRRRVALKIIKLGMDTKSVIARFEAERQALALMDHPNIAKVLDAGATETGRPYFVMELVRGAKITEYCDEKKLSTRGRLDLFVQVCHAVQHAHQKGIIHRDIKPSNILVSEDDGVMVPKVIDFGIAKATGGQLLTDKTVFTAFEQFIGTPAYMSPEQALVTNADIDTRSDIYALGVLLYELLTGKTPFDSNELLKIGLDEMRRTIRETEPPRPSTRLSTLGGEELNTAAHRRGLEAPKLVSELRGDLDWVIMKALEKDRARRYETANGLAADIQRHLNNEPVVACPPNRLYQFRKMVRRNKLAFTAGCAVAASLALGLTFSTISFFRERAARKRADEQTAVARAVNDFLEEDLLRQADSRFQAEAHFTPDPNLTVRAALDRAAERIGERFKNQPLQEAGVRMAIGNALIGLGKADKAIEHLKRALELRRLKLGGDDPDTLTSMYSLAWAYQIRGKLDEARALIEDTVRLRKMRLGPANPDTLKAINLLANIYELLGKTNEALAQREKLLDIAQTALGPDDHLTIYTIQNLALSYENAGKLELGLPLREKGTKLARERLGNEHPLTSLGIETLAEDYLKIGRVKDALSLSQEALELKRTYQGETHPETLAAAGKLADVYLAAQKPDEAISVLQKTLEVTQSKLASNDLQTAWVENELAIVYAQARRPNQGLPLLEDAVKIRKTVLGRDDSETWKAMRNLGLLCLAAGKFDRAIEVRSEMLEIARASHVPDDPFVYGAMGELGVAYRAVHNFEKAVPLLEGAVKGYRHKLSPDDANTLRWMNELGLAYWWSGRLDEALQVFQDATERNRKKFGPDNQNTLMTMYNLGWASLDAGKLEEALRVLKDRLNIIRAAHGPDALETLDEMSTLAEACEKAGDFDQAIRLVSERFQITQKKFGPNNPHTLIAMENLGVSYDKAGKIDQALPLFERTVELMKTNMPPNAPETLFAMRNLAVAFEGTRHPDQALSLGKELFKLSEEKFGPDHAETLNALGDLVGFLLEVRNFPEAEDRGKELAERLQQGKGRPLPASAPAVRGLANLGKNLLERQQGAKAEQVLRDYLINSEKAGAGSWEAFSARSLLGGALLGQRKFAEAQPLIVSGYDELKKQAAARKNLDNDARDDLRGAMDRLEELYDQRQDDRDSARWKAEMEQVRHINDAGAIRHWLVLAPIPLGTNQSPVEGLAQEQLPNERLPRPRAGDKARVGSGELAWREINLRDYLIDFDRLFGEEKPWSVAYAVCYLRVNAPRKELRIKVGSDDQARIYLNGKQIYENLRGRALLPDEDTVSNVELRSGINVVVFKIVNGEELWKGSLRFTEKDGQPVQGIEVTLNPDKPLEQAKNP